MTTYAKTAEVAAKVSRLRLWGILGKKHLLVVNTDTYTSTIIVKASRLQYESVEVGDRIYIIDQGCFSFDYYFFAKEQNG